jgi:hypothetical protein
MKTYKQHLNESAGKKVHAMSESAMKHVTEMSEKLCNEGKAYHDDPHPDHTYESYVKEVCEYMKEKMNEKM